MRYGSGRFGSGAVRRALAAQQRHRRPSGRHSKIFSKRPTSAGARLVGCIRMLHRGSESIVSVGRSVDPISVAGRQHGGRGRSKNSTAPAHAAFSYYADCANRVQRSAPASIADGANGRIGKAGLRRQDDPSGHASNQAKMERISRGTAKSRSGPFFGQPAISFPGNRWPKTWT